MEVGNIIGSSQLNFMTRVELPTLDEGQEVQFQEILSHYNSEDFSNEDKIDLKEELKAAEIPLGTETYQIMVDAGFSEADGAAHTRGERTDKTVSTPADIQNFSLNDVFQQLYSGQITGEEFTAQFEQLKEQLNSSVGSLINTTT